MNKKNKNIFLTSVLGLDFDLELLPHFVEHYLALGIEPKNFLLVLNCFKNPENLQEGIKILKSFNIEPRDLWTTEYESIEKWHRVDRMLSAEVTSEDWVVHPDFDEFHKYPYDLHTVIDKFEEKGINAVQGVLIDRVGPEGEIVNVTDGVSIWEQFPLETNFARLLHIAGVKLMMYRGDMRANNGSGEIHDKCKNIVKYPYGTRGLHHFDFTKKVLGDFNDKSRTFKPGQYAEQEEEWNKLKSDFGFLVYHFKWTGLVIEKLKQRVQTYRRLQRAQWFQSQNFLDYYDENKKILT